MKWLKVGGIITAAVVVTALGIDASDTLTGKSGTLLGQVFSSSVTAICPEGMVQVGAAQSFTCADAFEVSAGTDCPVANPSNEFETKDNIDTASCAAVSVKDAEPWRYVTREQASVACLRAGKRLPKSEEWYLFAAGTPDTKEVCTIKSDSFKHTGQSPLCVSASGVYDTTGNVWEWTSDDVIEGVYQGRELPEEGYVAQVDSSGVATVTNGTQPSVLFYKDYLWTQKEGSFGILRGGFYGSNEDAGLYAVHARTIPTTAGTAIGFRCIK